jgi:hypothetical protein
MHPGGDELYPLPRTTLDAQNLEILTELVATVTRGGKGMKSTAAIRPCCGITLRFSGESGKGKNGEPGAARTHDPRLKSPLYRRRKPLFYPQTLLESATKTVRMHCSPISIMRFNQECDGGYNR